MNTRTKLLTGVVTALMALPALAGCTATTAMPVPTPTPTVLSTSQAATLYLQTVCPVNAAADVYSAAWTATPVDLATVKSLAVQLATAETKQANTFDDKSILWPESVKPDMQTMADNAFSTLSWLSGIQNATTLEAANVAAPAGDAAATASQRIRSRLGLSSDTSASCIGVQ